MKMFIALSALVAVASAGLLPHRGSHNSGYHYEGAASSHNGYDYQKPQGSESQIDNSYLQPAASEQRVSVAQPDVYLVKEQLHDNNGLEGYHYGFELSDGQKKDETAELRNFGSEEGPAIVVRGSYTWVDAEGKEHKITYIADENGFQPQGDDIPRA